MSACRLIARPVPQRCSMCYYKRSQSDQLRGWEAVTLSFSPISSPSDGNLPFLNDTKFQVMLIGLHPLLPKNEGTEDPLPFCGISLGSSGNTLQNYCKSQTVRLPCTSHGCALLFSSDQTCAFAVTLTVLAYFRKAAPH